MNKREENHAALIEFANLANQEYDKILIERNAMQKELKLAKEQVVRYKEKCERLQSVIEDIPGNLETKTKHAMLMTDLFHSPMGFIFEANNYKFTAFAVAEILSSLNGSLVKTLNQRKICHILRLASKAETKDNFLAAVWLFVILEKEYVLSFASLAKVYEQYAKELRLTANKGKEFIDEVTKHLSQNLRDWERAVLRVTLEFFETIDADKAKALDKNTGMLLAAIEKLYRNWEWLVENRAGAGVAAIEWSESFALM